MRTNRLLIPFLVAGLALAVGAGLILGQEAVPSSIAALQVPVGSGFTYQGELRDADGPVSGDCQMAFRLYDDSVGGSQVGGAITATVPVSDGLFAKVLNDAGQFGPDAFNGEARWLGIKVDCGGGYADLGRQPLTAAPYASYASVAPWSGLSGVPAGFADGVDDDTTYTPGAGLDLAAYEFSVDFAGSGSASTAARSDHDHDGTYAQAIRGHIDTPTNDGTNDIDYPFVFDITELGTNLDSGDVEVVASGFKKSAGGAPEMPVMSRWSIASTTLTTTLTLRVWDANGVQFKSTAPIPAQWSDKRVELSLVVVR